MVDYKILIAVGVIVAIILFLLLSKREKLSLSQFPQPTPANVPSDRNCVTDPHFFPKMDEVGTFDSGSTFAQAYAGPPPYPQIAASAQIKSQAYMPQLSERDIFDHVEKGGTVVAANDLPTINKVIGALINETASGGGQGCPDFYEVRGPLMVLNKSGRNYYWMIDQPIRYTPSNVFNFVNTSTDYKIAKTALNRARRAMNPTAAVVFLD